MSCETLGVGGGTKESERRFRDKLPCVGKISLRVAVFARDGRGGGAVPVIVGLLAAKGSLSRFFGVLCLRAGGVLCSEFRTLGDWEILEEVAGDKGGGGAALDGRNGS